MLTPPHGLSFFQLSDSPTLRHEDARTFCLQVIKEFYGYDYNAEWHADLDSLLLPTSQNHYSSVERGAFWVLTEPDGTIVATVGIRALHWKPQFVAAFAERYPNPGKVASLWREYVRKDRRRTGLGKWLTRLAEEAAGKFGYQTMYLHATSDATDTVAFWKAMGYRIIGEDSSTTHFDKTIDGSVLGDAGGASGRAGDMHERQ